MGLRQEVTNAWNEVLSPLFAEFSTEVLVESVDTVATAPDPLYDEPALGKAFTPPVAVRARVKLEKDRLVTPGGEDIEIDGRITVRTEELEEKGIPLALGDRVTIDGDRYTVVHREIRAQVDDEFLLTRAGLRKEIP